MIIVTGSVRARDDTLDEVITLSLEHVHRSRGEPGCLLRSVHQDVEDRLKLVFLEHWRDREALDAHFAVPESLEFVTAVTALAAQAPTLDVYEVAMPRTRS